MIRDEGIRDKENDSVISIGSHKKEIHGFSSLRRCSSPSSGVTSEGKKQKTSTSSWTKGTLLQMAFMNAMEREKKNERRERETQAVREFDANKHS